MSSVAPIQTAEFDAIGTHWRIDATSSALEWEQTLFDIRNLIEEFDRQYSRFRADSWVSALKNNPGSHVIPHDFLPLWNIYAMLYERTDGLFTPLIGDTLEASGYDASYSLQARTLHSPPPWEDVLKLEGDRLTVSKPVLLDFGAGGKGYLIDLVAKLLSAASYREYIIDAGGDIRQQTATQTTSRVALEHPDDFSLAIGVANLQNQSIAGSAGNRRSWGEYHHILNPKTLRSVREIKAVWVIADTTLLADCLSTCLFFVKPRQLQEVGKFEYLVVYEDMTIDRSESFPGEIFVA